MKVEREEMCKTEGFSNICGVGDCPGQKKC